jgi:sugar phosphate isomerase/epimerase
MARISIQMWTVRQEAERSLPATLASLKRIGYGAVETAGLYGLSPASMRAELASAGLELSSAHTPLPTLETAAATFGQLTELGATAVFPSLKPESFADDAAIGRAADAFNAVLPMAKEHGVELGYHNHWWEFERGPDGQLAYQKFLDRLDPDVTVEVDRLVGSMRPTLCARSASGPTTSTSKTGRSTQRQTTSPPSVTARWMSIAC